MTIAVMMLISEWGHLYSTDAQLSPRTVVMVTLVAVVMLVAMVTLVSVVATATVGCYGHNLSLYCVDAVAMVTLVCVVAMATAVRLGRW